jgi:hypothetical protein
MLLFIYQSHGITLQKTITSILNSMNISGCISYYLFYHNNILHHLSLLTYLVNTFWPLTSSSVLIHTHIYSWWQWFKMSTELWIKQAPLNVIYDNGFLKNATSVLVITVSKCNEQHGQKAKHFCFKITEARYVTPNIHYLTKSIQTFICSGKLNPRYHYGHTYQYKRSQKAGCCSLLSSTSRLGELSDFERGLVIGCHIRNLSGTL